VGSGHSSSKENLAVCDRGAAASNEGRSLGMGGSVSWKLLLREWVRCPKVGPVGTVPSGANGPAMALLKAGLTWLRGASTSMNGSSLITGSCIMPPGAAPFGEAFIAHGPSSRNESKRSFSAFAFGVVGDKTQNWPASKDGGNCMPFILQSKEFGSVVRS